MGKMGENVEKNACVGRFKFRSERDTRAMEPSDARILLIVFALFIVTSILDPGPLRSYIETYLVLSFVPGLLTVISILELLGSGIDPGSWLFYVKLLWIISTGYLSIVFYSWLKQKVYPIFRKYTE